MDHPATVIIVTLITIYALFFDDIRVLAFKAEDDEVFSKITFFCIVVYALELCLASISVEGYVLNFFFWLDIISTLSMVPDCGFIWDPIVGDGGGNAGNATSNATSLAKNSRAGKVTRVIRIIRLIRLIRIVKLYKQAKKAQRAREQKLQDGEKTHTFVQRQIEKNKQKQLQNV